MEAVKAIEMRQISKSFGSVKANEAVNLTVHHGEVHALLGENGAGKSTLMNMLSGIYTPDGGSIIVNGKEVHFTSPKDSIDTGIGMIHQHFKLAEVLTAQENILMGQRGGFFLQKKESQKELMALSDRYGLDLVPDKKVYTMSIGEKQALEILKVLHRGAKILVMDEPTAVLTPQEIERLFLMIHKMKEQGCAVIIITHKLNEVMEISDRITVLRQGHTVGTVNTKEIAVPTLIEMMVGKAMDLALTREDCPKTEGLLEIKNLSISTKTKQNAVNNISFSLAGGEILGVAGVAGSGQKEICEAIAGLLPPSEGNILMEGASLLGKSPRDIIRLGIRIGFIPEDRLGMGLIGSMDMVHNIILKDYQLYSGPFLHRKKSIEKAKKIKDALDIQTPGIDYPIKRLSGGNIQKVLLGRELDAAPKVLITAYPARGLDIGASYKIYGLLQEQRKNGTGILFIGEDLDVLMGLCDRILVVCGGEITGIVRPEETSREEIGLMMTGHGKKEESA